MVVIFAAAGVAALIGRIKLRESSPPLPENAIESVEADVRTVKTAAREGRHA